MGHSLFCRASMFEGGFLKQIYEWMNKKGERNFCVENRRFPWKNLKFLCPYRRPLRFISNEIDAGGEWYSPCNYYVLISSFSLQDYNRSIRSVELVGGRHSSLFYHLLYFLHATLLYKRHSRRRSLPLPGVSPNSSRRSHTSFSCTTLNMAL